MKLNGMGEVESQTCIKGKFSLLKIMFHNMYVCTEMQCKKFPYCG